MTIDELSSWGYCCTGRPDNARQPTSTSTRFTTIARTGCLMKTSVNDLEDADDSDDDDVPTTNSFPPLWRGRLARVSFFQCARARRPRPGAQCDPRCVSATATSTASRSLNDPPVAT